MKGFFIAKPTAHPLRPRSLLKQVSHHCHLLSTTRPMPGCRGNFTYIPVKTTATNALMLACRTLTPEAEGSNPGWGFFGLYTFSRDESTKGAAHESTEGVIVCNT